MSNYFFCLRRAQSFFSSAPQGLRSIPHGSFLPGVVFPAFNLPHFYVCSASRRSFAYSSAPGTLWEVSIPILNDIPKYISKQEEARLLRHPKRSLQKFLETGRNVNPNTILAKAMPRLVSGLQAIPGEIVQFIFTPKKQDLYRAWAELDHILQSLHSTLAGEMHLPFHFSAVEPFRLPTGEKEIGKVQHSMSGYWTLYSRKKGSDAPALHFAFPILRTFTILSEERRDNVGRIMAAQYKSFDVSVYTLRKANIGGMLRFQFREAGIERKEALFSRHLQCNKFYLHCHPSLPCEGDFLTLAKENRFGPTYVYDVPGGEGETPSPPGAAIARRGYGTGWIPPGHRNFSTGTTEDLPFYLPVWTPKATASLTELHYRCGCDDDEPFRWWNHRGTPLPLVELPLLLRWIAYADRHLEWRSAIVKGLRLYEREDWDWNPIPRTIGELEAAAKQSALAPLRLRCGPQGLDFGRSGHRLLDQVRLIWMDAVKRELNSRWVPFSSPIPPISSPTVAEGGSQSKFEGDEKGVDFGGNEGQNPPRRGYFTGKGAFYAPLFSGGENRPAGGLWDRRRVFPQFCSRRGLSTVGDRLPAFLALRDPALAPELEALHIQAGGAGKAFRPRAQAGSVLLLVELGTLLSWMVLAQEKEHYRPLIEGGFSLHLGDWTTLPQDPEELALCAKASGVSVFPMFRNSRGTFDFNGTVRGELNRIILQMDAEKGKLGPGQASLSSPSIFPVPEKKTTAKRRPSEAQGPRAPSPAAAGPESVTLVNTLVKRAAQDQTVSKVSSPTERGLSPRERRMAPNVDYRRPLGRALAMLAAELAQRKREGALPTILWLGTSQEKALMELESFLFSRFPHSILLGGTGKNLSFGKNHYPEGAKAQSFLYEADSSLVEESTSLYFLLLTPEEIDRLWEYHAFGEALGLFSLELHVFYPQEKAPLREFLQRLLLALSRRVVDTNGVFRFRPQPSIGWWALRAELGERAILLSPAPPPEGLIPDSPHSSYAQRRTRALFDEMFSSRGYELHLWRNPSSGQVENLQVVAKGDSTPIFSNADSALEGLYEFVSEEAIALDFWQEQLEWLRGGAVRGFLLWYASKPALFVHLIPRHHWSSAEHLSLPKNE